MELIKLGRKGQVSIPRAVFARLGLKGGVTMLVETTSDGAIVLRLAGVYPIEIYSDERICEFDEADRMDEETAAQIVFDHCQSISQIRLNPADPLAKGLAPGLFAWLGSEHIAVTLGET